MPVWRRWNPSPCCNTIVDLGQRQQTTASGSSSLVRFFAKAPQMPTHIAIAITFGVDYLVTWHFRHIANGSNALDWFELTCRVRQITDRSGICTPNVSHGIPTMRWYTA